MCSTPASSAGRPATVTPNTTSSRPLSRPSRMPHAVCITVFSVSACSRAGRLSEALSAAVERQHDLLGRQRLAARRPRRQPRALLEPGQRLPPDRKPRRTVLPGDEGEIVAVRRHPRQRRRAAMLRINLEQLPHQDRRRPAVHQQVMVADQQAGAGPPPAGSAQTASAAAPPDRTAPGGRLRQMLLSSRCCPAAPCPDRSISRHGTAARDTTTCTGRLSCSCRKPARRLACRSTTACNEASSTAAIERAFKLELELHRIDVGSLRIVERMEQQTLLQRRQRQDVLDRPDTHPPAARSRLASDRPAADRSASARRRRAAPHAASVPSAPGTRVSARSRTAASSSSAPAHSPVRRQPRAVRFIQRQRVDLDQMRQRQRRIAAASRAASPLSPSARRPVGALRSSREPAQIVEAELRRCSPGKLRRGLHR